MERTPGDVSQAGAQIIYAPEPEMRSPFEGEREAMPERSDEER